MAHFSQLAQNFVTVENRSRHQDGRLAASVTKHNALVARTLFFVQTFTLINTLGNVGALAMNIAINTGVFPMEAVLFVSNTLNCIPRCLDHRLVGNITTNLTCQHNLVRGC